jgi:mono/diheme cytochrome c family protein
MPTLFPGRAALVLSASLTVSLIAWPRLDADSKPSAPARVDYVKDVRPILQPRCYSCHGPDKQKSGLRLDVKHDALKGGDSGAAIVPNKTAESLLLQRVTSEDKATRMPPKGERLTPAEVDTLRTWITSGAAWPDGVDVAKTSDRREWWSFKPVTRPTLPKLTDADAKWARNPIDAFIVAKQREKGLSPSPEADRRTLIRRLYFDLIGLPPAPAEVEAFVRDKDPQAYQKLVDRLLDSPRYGERWARHWLDVVHYGDTHGYDKDQPRPNAWPYRDYVIRAFNSDKPYTRFVQEQLAGDVLFGESVDGITATGFIAAGPWDFIGHVEVPESKYDGKVARNLDRDDMVTNAMNTFVSLTVQCARCHNHKFDPVTQEDYYRLQAVFAALDRADRAYDTDPVAVRRRGELEARRRPLSSRQKELETQAVRAGGAALAKIERELDAATRLSPAEQKPAFGYHSDFAATEDVVKWVQIDLGEPIAIDSLLYVGCHDNFGNIGAGFGFPRRFKIEVANDADFRSEVITVVDRTKADVPNPGVVPQKVAVGGKKARYVRVTASKLFHRQDTFIFALAELQVHDSSGKNRALGAKVTSLDSIEAPPRWRRANLVDGYYFGAKADAGEITRLRKERDDALAKALGEATRDEWKRVNDELASIQRELAKLPAPGRVYAGTVHYGRGAFAGTGASGGKPRAIHVLKRGDVRSLGAEVGPGTVALRPGEDGRFDLPSEHTEGQRRVALARWITDPQNPLTLRSIVNRVWQYHFGRGIVDSPNDFGHMGRLPSHPELLDWLAADFRNNGQSFKRLHRMICNSATYRQTSAEREARSAEPLPGARPSEILAPRSIDSDNIYLWHMSRRRLEAEAVRDSVLAIAGKLDDRLGGPGFQDFIVEKPEHSPHYEYQRHDPEDVRTHRRSIYRFLVRSQPQPFMTTLDCADPSMSVDKRNETVTALQALALLNNRFMLAMAKHTAARVEKSADGVEGQVSAAFRLAIAREPSATEREMLTAYAKEHGLANACRLIFNLNEFVFVD